MTTFEKWFSELDDVQVTRFTKQNKAIAKLAWEAALERLKKQFSEDVCHKSSCGRSADGGLAEIDSICRNRPPETTNLMNACLSCPLQETCKVLFVEK